MKKQLTRIVGLSLIGLTFVFGCAYDDTLREYLDVHFWLPFSKNARHFEKKNIARVSLPFAGMVNVVGDTPLLRLRAAYQEISDPNSQTSDFGSVRDRLQRAVIDARADSSLMLREREEVDLIDAKIEMRAGESDQPELLPNADKKFKAFLRSAGTPEFLSEARGWLAHIYYLLGEQTEAGKIYLDELNRNGSNLSSATLLTSLRMTYGYDGGPDLLTHLDSYFDTPEHAAFAIQLVTNPHWDRYSQRYGKSEPRIDHTLESYERIRALLEKHADLLKSQSGANALALLGMRTALRMGDPATALKIGETVLAGSSIREEPDFNWMLASAHFLSRDYQGAELPLTVLFNSGRASKNEQSAAAYGLCGVYEKTKSMVKQIRFALWLHTASAQGSPWDGISGIRDQSVYWATSGWDLNMLLDTEASIDTLQEFIDKYPRAPDIRVVKYSLAVRLTRENRYREAAQVYDSIRAVVRAPRIRRLAALYEETNHDDLPAEKALEAKYNFAEFLSANPNRIYFNDALWSGLQRAALIAGSDNRLTLEERQSLLNSERKLKDDQEERWRAYLILRGVVRDAGKSDLGKKAARLAIQCLRRISDRFGRQDEIRAADIELANWLQP